MAAVLLWTARWALTLPLAAFHDVPTVKIGGLLFLALLSLSNEVCLEPNSTDNLVNPRDEVK